MTGNGADIFGTVGRAAVRLQAQRAVIRKKIKIGLPKMIETLQAIHTCLHRTAEKVRANPYFGPSHEAKELASLGFTLHKIVKMAVDEEEAESFADVLIRRMSSRRILLEIEEAKDKEALQETLDQAVAAYQALIDGLSGKS